MIPENIEKWIKDTDIDTNAGMDKLVLDDVLKALEQSKKPTAVKQPGIWRIIVRSRISTLAAAAVIILTIGLFFVGHDQQESIDNNKDTQIKSPSEMLTLASLNAAYLKGELEAVENRYERVLEMMEPWPSKVSIPELFEELDGS